MTPAAAKPAIGLDAAAVREASYRLIGLLIVSLFPALFWTTVAAVGASALGAPLSPLALATIGAAIAAFLAAVFNQLFARI
jgi:hypothetical protein